MITDFDAFEALVRARRTNLLIDRAREVDPELVDRLCRLVPWAPNHKRTWPWRMAVITGASRDRLGAALADDQADSGETDEARLAKTRRKYGRAPVVVAIATVPADSPEHTVENRDAVAAGVQNLLLGAAALGLAGFWSSPPAARGRRTLAFCDFPDDAELVALVYLGWPEQDVPAPERPDPGIRYLA